jgi:hypothetical protein
VVGGRIIEMKKNNDSFKYRNRLNDEKDFPKIKTIPKKLHKSWGIGKSFSSLSLFLYLNESLFFFISIILPPTTTNPEPRSLKVFSFIFLDVHLSI